jgi:putative ABC transport system permease protein
MIAGYTAGQRAKRVPRGKYIAGVSIIPVAGMLVGSTMTVTGVTMKKLREDVKIQRNLVS